MSELLYGRHAVLEALRAGRRQFYRLWVEGEQPQQPSGILGEILAEAQGRAVPVRPVHGGLFDKLRIDQVNAQGVALESGDYPYADWEECLLAAKQRHEPPLILILDHLQDPQNLGTLIRSAEAMGVHGILLPDRRAARVTTRPGPHLPRRSTTRSLPSEPVPAEPHPNARRGPSSPLFSLRRRVTGPECVMSVSRQDPSPRRFPSRLPPSSPSVGLRARPVNAVTS